MDSTVERQFDELLRAGDVSVRESPLGELVIEFPLNAAPAVFSYLVGLQNANPILPEPSLVVVLNSTLGIRSGAPKQ